MGTTHGYLFSSRRGRTGLDPSKSPRPEDPGRREYGSPVGCLSVYLCLYRLSPSGMFKIIDISRIRARIGLCQDTAFEAGDLILSWNGITVDDHLGGVENCF